MKKSVRYFCVLCFGLVGQNVFAQTDSLKLRKQLNQLMAYSISVNTLTLGQTFFYSEQNFTERNFNPLFFSTNALQHLPNLLKGKGFGILGFQAATTASFYITKENPNDFPLFNRALFVPSYNLSLFASYTAYRDKRVSSGYQLENWKAFKISELIFSPYEKEIIKNPFVWGSVIGAVALNFLTNNASNSVFTTKKTFIGNREYSPWAAIPLMIGTYWAVHTLIGASEEAHYRGVAFEQMRQNTTTFWANAFDMLYFTSSHFPQYYVADRENLFLRTASSAAFSFLMSSAYRHSGLRTSAAAHIAFNFFSSTSFYLLNGGVANQNNYLTFSLTKNF